MVSPSESGFDPRVNLAYGDVKLGDLQDPKYLEVRVEDGSIPPGGHSLSWEDLR